MSITVWNWNKVYCMISKVYSNNTIHWGCLDPFIKSIRNEIKNVIGNIPGGTDNTHNSDNSMH